jgi:hypothetical protein
MKLPKLIFYNLFLIFKKKFMNMKPVYKVIFFLFLFIFSFTIKGLSQPPISISASIGSYSTISGTGVITLNAASNGEAISTISSLPFNIRYNNTSYSTLYVSTKGTISFNRPFINYLPFFVTLQDGDQNSENLDFIAVFWHDLVADQIHAPFSQVKYIVEGTAPNRTLTIEWDKLFLWSDPILYNPSDEVLSFQAKFFENSENIEFKYKKNNSFINPLSGGRPVGLQFLNNTYYTVTELTTNAQLSQNITNYTNYIDSYNDGLTLLFYPTPTISISTPLASLTSCKGTVSTPTSFNVNGSNLTASVTISAPSKFEISRTPGGSYSSSLTLNNASTVTETLYVRMSTSASFGLNSGTISATSIGAASVTTIVSGTVLAKPTLSANAISLCAEATYLITKTTSMPVDNGWSVSGTITVNNGYVTAGTIQGSYTVIYTDGCAQTASATVIVNNSNNGVTAITDGLASYKINNTNPIPQGPTATLYVGYNGFNYTSATKPTNTGFYNANNQSSNSAGCPYPFYIFRCTTCPD